MHVFTTFARRFYWSDLNLWPEDLAPGSVVLLSGKDDLMDAAEVKDMLEVAGHVKVGPELLKQPSYQAAVSLLKQRLCSVSADGNGPNNLTTCGQAYCCVSCTQLMWGG